MHTKTSWLARLCSFECISFYIHNAFGCWPFGCYVYNCRRCVDTETKPNHKTNKNETPEAVADIINSIKKVTFLLFLIRFLFRLYLQMDLLYIKLLKRNYSDSFVQSII